MDERSMEIFDETAVKKRRPKLDADGNPIKKRRPKLDADGNPVKKKRLKLDADGNPIKKVHASEETDEMQRTVEHPKASAKKDAPKHTEAVETTAEFDEFPEDEAFVKTASKRNSGEKASSRKKKSSSGKKRSSGRKKKGSNRGLILGWALFVIALIVFLVSGFFLIKIGLNYKKGDDTYQSLARQVIIFPEEEDVEETEDEEEVEEEQGDILPTIDWALLSTLSKDVEGWIYFPYTDISYPIVHRKDNEYYLSHMYDGTPNSAGSIFVDKDNGCNFVDRNTIVYGHNMKNGSMFGKLKKYSKREFFEENPYFYILTPTYNYRCDIFSVHVVDENSSYYTMTFADDAAYKSYLDKSHRQAMYDTGVTVSTLDKIVMLSTCTAGETNRLIVQAVFHGVNDPLPVTFDETEEE